MFFFRIDDPACWNGNDHRCVDENGTPLKVDFQEDYCEDYCCCIIAGGTILDTYTILSSGISAGIGAIREGDGISAGSLDWRNENNNALQVCYYMYLF